MIKAYFTPLVITLCFIAIVVLSVLLIHEKQQAKVNSSQAKALADTITYYKTENNKNAAYISVLQGTRKDLLELTKTKDKEANALLKKIKDLEILVKLQTVTHIDTITKADTVYIEKDGQSIDPDSIYISKALKTPYYEGSVKFVSDSVQLSLEVYNDFDFSHHYKSNGWFKPKTLVVDVVNKNPMTITTGLSSYKITQPKRKGLKAAVVIAGVITGYLILK